MSSGMPELGSKISLISKADIRYEGRLFTVDPQECTIALASVRSFGTEDRETQYPVAPQSQVYDYILFRGTDIKDIRVLTNVSAMPNDPAIVQMSVPPSLGGAGNQPQFPGPYNHPVVGHSQFNQYHPMAGFQGGVHTQLGKTSELSPQTSVELTQPQPVTAPIGSGVVHHSNQVKDQGSMLDLIGGGSQQSASRSDTPGTGSHRKSPTADRETQVGSVAGGSGQRDSRRAGNAGAVGGAGPVGGGAGGKANSRARPSSRTRQRVPSGSGQPPQPQPAPHQQHVPHAPHQQHAQHAQHQPPDHHHQTNDQHHYQSGQGYNRGGWRGGRARGRGRGSFAPRNKNTLKFDNDYDFEQANTEFEELRSQLAKTKISEPEVKPTEVVEVDKKDDSGNETGAGEEQLDDDSQFMGYDKKKSFFDNISCEAVERSKGRSQRTDWRTERKLNSETFGVASARRGAWRGRAAWRHPHAAHPHNSHPHPHAHPHMPHMGPHQPWRTLRGGRGRTGPAPRPRPHAPHATHAPLPAAAPQPQPQPPTAAAK